VQFSIFSTQFSGGLVKQVIRDICGRRQYHGNITKSFCYC